MFPVIESPPVLLGLAGLLGYVLGSVSFGMVAARVFGLGDLRGIGSGNIGATNVLRTGSRKAAALTLAGDAGKGAVAVVSARLLLGEDAAQAAGLGAFLGHLYPVFIGFRGGKGFATFLGTMLALSFPVGLAACALWLVVAALFRFSSLAAMAAALGAPGLALILGVPELTGLAGLLAVLLFWRHRENTSRLLAGTESRIGRNG